MTTEYFDVQAEYTEFYSEPNGAYSRLDKDEEEYERLGMIDERDLVDFARQIAAGMVT